LEINLRPGGALRQNVDVAILSTFSSSLWLAVLARLAAALFGQPSISVWDLAVISIVGGAIGSVLGLAITIGLSAPAYRPRGGPRLRLDPDGHRPRRHDHAPEPVPGHVPDPERGGRRRPQRPGRRRRRGRDGPVVHGTRPPGATDHRRDDRDDPPHADPRRARGRARAGTARRASCRARAPVADPTVRVAGGRARRDLLVPDHLEAPDRRDHTLGPPPHPRDRGRPLRGRSVRPDLHADRGDFVGPPDPARAPP